jgi:putative endonuclease
MSSWYVYILRCDDGSFYTGITTDVKRRVHEHNTTKKGAKYTKSRRPVHLIWSWRCLDRSHATYVERKIKKLPRAKKLEIVADPENWKGFS